MFQKYFCVDLRRGLLVAAEVGVVVGGAGRNKHDGKCYEGGDARPYQIGMPACKEADDENGKGHDKEQ